MPSVVLWAFFEEGTAKDLRNALTELEGERAAAVILDLRNNPGGILEEAVAAASQFLPSGNVLLVRDAQGSVKPVPVCGRCPSPVLGITDL